MCPLETPDTGPTELSRGAIGSGAVAAITDRVCPSIMPEVPRVTLGGVGRMAPSNKGSQTALLPNNK